MQATLCILIQILLVSVMLGKQNLSRSWGISRAPPCGLISSLLTRRVTKASNQLALLQHPSCKSAQKVERGLVPSSRWRWKRWRHVTWQQHTQRKKTAAIHVQHIRDVRNALTWTMNKKDMSIRKEFGLANKNHSLAHTKNIMPPILTLTPT